MRLTLFVQQSRTVFLLMFSHWLCCITQILVDDIQMQMILGFTYFRERLGTLWLAFLCKHGLRCMWHGIIFVVTVKPIPGPECHIQSIETRLPIRF